MTRLNNILKDHSNGLTQSRLILAFFVLLDHQYTLLEIPKPRFLSGGLTLSGFAVYMFIFMSGLLCFVSRSRNSAPRFLLLRFARIIPGYLACLAVTSLLFIPILSGLALKANHIYMSYDKRTMLASADYFLNNFAFTQNIYLPVDLKIENPIRAINGSLWTLQPEIMGYLLIAILFPLFCMVPRLLVMLFGIGVFFLAITPATLRTGLQAVLAGYGFEIGTDSHLLLGVYLLSGIIYAIYSSRIYINPKIGFLFILLLTASYHTELRVFNLISPVILPYSFICVCWMIRWPWGPQADYSYGVYLYSFPIQQIVWNLKQAALISNGFLEGLLLVSLASLALGVLSFYLVERPCRSSILSAMTAKH